MKRIWSVLPVVLLGICVAAAQDAAKVAPKNVKVLLENEKVRVLDFDLKKGEKVPMHSHPAYVVIGIAASKFKTTMADGKSTEMELKAGEVRWSEPVTHANEAISDGHVVVVELKEPMKMEKK